MALASENSAPIFAAAAIPLHFYCQKHHWPSEKTFAKPVNPALWSVSNLHYYSEKNYYIADFQLKSFVANDDFIVDWHMTIPEPDPEQKIQTVSILLEAKAYNVLLPFEYEFLCAGGSDVKNPTQNS